MSSAAELMRGYQIDEDNYQATFNPKDPEHLEELRINGYLAMLIEVYKDSGRKNRRLLELFQEDFEEFTIDIFAIANRVALRKFRETLLVLGVYVKPARGVSYARVLYDCFIAEDLAEWTSEGIQERRALTGEKPETTPMQSPRAEQSVIPPQQQQQALPLPNTVPPNTMPTPNTVPPPTDIPPQNEHTGQAQYGYQAPFSQPYPNAQNPAYHLRQPATSPFRLFPPVPTPPSYQQPNVNMGYQPAQQQNYVQQPVYTQGTAKLLTELTKLYTEDKKYSGDLYDVLDSKIRIVNDCCQKIGLTDQANAFCSMLNPRFARRS